MTLRLLDYLLTHYRPREGWLPLLLLFGAAGCLIWSVLGVGWVPEDGIVVPTVLLGLLLGVVLAKRPLSPLPAWLLIIAYGLLANLLWLGRLWPPWGYLLGEWELLRQFWIQRGAVFLDRLLGWLQAILAGDSSQETLSFALGLGLLSWFLAAYVGWATYREKRPLNALLIMGTALALNGYYGAAPYFPVALFVALAALLAALLHFDQLQQQWEARLVDYSTQIRVDLLLHAGLAALVLLSFAYLLPVFNPSQVARALLRQPAVIQAEQTFERVFGGVRPPAGPLAEEAGAGPGSPGGPGGAGILPRAYLLGNAPELSETVVMTATVSWANPPPPDRTRLERWRALSYDVYTGRGWAISEERTEIVAAFDSIPLPPIADQTTISQTVHWLFDERLIRYTLGQPLRFDQATTARWRGQTDLARVARTSEGAQMYTAVSRHTNASAADLRTASLAEVEPVVRGRYTNLPAGLPERVAELAQEIAGDQPTPYDQAQALVAFLNQYPYTLDVGVPPAGRDVVDYFLFEAQTGYCDYYASALVVMARSLGLPARLVVGYLSPPPDEAGVTTVRQIESHSWAEIYFAGFGWVEFEPTRPFAPGVDEAWETAVPPTFTDPDTPLSDTDPPPLPQPDREPGRWPLGWLLLATLLALPGWLLWRVWQAEQGLRQGGIVWVYGRVHHHIHRWGQPTPPQQTPAEFEQALNRRLDKWATSLRRQQVAARMRPHLARLVGWYNEERYRGGANLSPQTTRVLWHHLRRPLWWLRLWGMVDRMRG
jgi:transglutaminase-like putative cysteine protease